jgi:hypothetical protein
MRAEIIFVLAASILVSIFSYVCDQIVMPLLIYASPLILTLILDFNVNHIMPVCRRLTPIHYFKFVKNNTFEKSFTLLIRSTTTLHLVIGICVVG